MAKSANPRQLARLSLNKNILTVAEIPIKGLLTRSPFLHYAHNQYTVLMRELGMVILTFPYDTGHSETG